MASASGEQLLDSTGQTECAICMDRFTDPCVLPCSHTFCRQCLIRLRHECSSWCKTDQDSSEVISCPSCRQMWPLPDGICVDKRLPSVNPEYQFNRTNVNDSISPPSCGSLETADVSSPGSEQVQSLPCPVHVDCVLDMFCWHCRQLVCPSCATSREHRDHSCDDARSSADRLRSLLLSDAASVDQQRRRCNEMESDVAVDKCTWLDSVQVADNEIKAAAVALRSLVDRHCAALCDELTAAKQLKLKELQSQIEDLAQERSRLDSLRKNLQTMVDAPVDTQLLIHAGSLHESVERCLADLTAVTSQTVLFVPSDTRTPSADGGDSLLGRVQVIGGAVESGQAAAKHVKPSSAVSEGPRHVRRHQQTQQPTLSYRQLLATLDGHLSVCGLAVVADCLYVCRSQSPDVDVYDAGRTTYRRRRSIRVPGLTEPSDMAGACSDDELESRLFISSEGDSLVFRVTLMVERAGDVVHTSWSTEDRPYSVSVTESKHLLVLSRQAASVSVLDNDGRQLRRLRLPASVASPWSALHLPSSTDHPAGELVVCHGALMLHNVDRHQCRCVSRLDWSTAAVTRRYEWFQQPSSDHHECSSDVHMVLESDASGAGGLLLADQCCDTVQRVDIGLTSYQPLMPTSSAAVDDSVVEEPRRLCVDSTHQRLVVGLHDGRVKVFANGCVVM